MKHIKIALLMAIPVLTLLIVGASVRPPAAQARISKVLTLTDVMCLTMNGTADWDQSGDLDPVLDSPAGLFTCGGLSVEGNFEKLTAAVEHVRFENGTYAGDVTHPEPEDFVKTDVDLGQLHQKDETMYIVAFVTNDDPVAFYVDRGKFSAGGKSFAICSGVPGADFQDEDCDGDGVRGDGVVVGAFSANGEDRGPGEIRVRQGGDEEFEPYTIVGEPDHITLKSFDPAIQTGAPACELFSDTATFLATLKAAETTVVVATVTDSDDTPITGALIKWTVDDTDNGDIVGSDSATLVVPYPLTFSMTPSLDLQALGVGSPETLCGADHPGTVKVKAQLITGGGPHELGADLDGHASLRNASIEVPVQGPPKAMTLAATPPSLVCDGTASSNVSATLTDADGKPAVNGNVVHYTVKALGSVNPIEAGSTDGAATTAVTPLAGVTSGVSVRGTLMLPVLEKAAPTPEPNQALVLAKTGYEASDLEQSTLVSCEEAAGTVPEVPPAGSPGAVISPPSTGDGGSQASSWWVAAPLGAVVLLLAGSGLALRRRTR